jgi:hypothetical protein
VPNPSPHRSLELQHAAAQSRREYDAWKAALTPLAPPAVAAPTPIARRRANDPSAPQRGHCVYCGAHVARPFLVCIEHRDLPKIDPDFSSILERMFPPAVAA